MSQTSKHNEKGLNFIMRNVTHIHTPILRSHPLSQLNDCNIYLKMETLQTSGSFKDRGIGKLCNYYAEKGIKGLVSSSGGNAGIAVAFAGRRLGLDIKVIVPQNTVPLTINKMKSEGADVITQGDVWDEADLFAKKLAEKLNYAYIPPFNNPLIWEGYESIIDELDADNIKPDAIITSVGGGGLFSGIIQGLMKHQWHDTHLITAETTGAATLATSYTQKKRIRLEKIDTIAITLGAKQLCQRAFELCMSYPTHPQIITDRQATNAVYQFANDHHTLVEPACGAALAIAYEQLDILKQFKNIVVIVCGGNGVSLNLINEWIKHFKL